MRKPVFTFGSKLPPKPKGPPLELSEPRKPTIGGLIMILSKYQQDTIKSNMEHKWSENRVHVQAMYDALDSIGFAAQLDWTGWPVKQTSEKKP